MEVKTPIHILKNIKVSQMLGNAMSMFHVLSQNVKFTGEVMPAPFMHLKELKHKEVKVTFPGSYGWCTKYSQFTLPRLDCESQTGDSMWLMMRYKRKIFVMITTSPSAFS